MCEVCDVISLQNDRLSSWACILFLSGVDYGEVSQNVRELTSEMAFLVDIHQGNAVAVLEEVFWVIGS